MKLIEPTMEYDRQIQAYRREFLEFGGSMDGCGSLRRFDRTQDWIDQVESLKDPETVPPNWVPSTQYIYVRESDEKIVGVIQIRHYFNEYLEKYAGHIGYSVCPSERRKGYAVKILGLMLEQARLKNMRRVLLGAYEGNIGSCKTIEKCGGILENTVKGKYDEEPIRRYWISISSR